MIEVCGNLIVELTKESDERSENYKAQMNAFFGLLEERFLDTNPYCRCKAIQVYTGKLLEYDHSILSGTRQLTFHLVLTLNFRSVVRRLQTSPAEV